MPNPFDQFDSAESANPFDQFDAPSEKKKKVSGKSYIDEVGRKAVLDFPDDFTEGARGVGAVALNSIAPMLAPVPAGLQYLNEKVKGNNPNFESLFANAMDSMSYHPDSEVAQNITNKAGQFANDVLIPGAMGVQGLPYVNTLGPVLGAIGRNFAKGTKPLVMSKAEALKAEKSKAAEIPTNVDPNVEFYKQEALKKQQAAQAAESARGQQPIVVSPNGTAFSRTVPLSPESPMDRMTRELGGTPGPLPPEAIVPDGSPMSRMAEDLQSPRSTAGQFDAQTAVESRENQFKTEADQRVAQAEAEANRAKANNTDSTPSPEHQAHLAEVEAQKQIAEQQAAAIERQRSIEAAQRAVEDRQAALEAEMRAKVADGSEARRLEELRTQTGERNAFLRNKQANAALFSEKEQARQKQVAEAAALAKRKEELVAERAAHEEYIQKLRNEGAASLERQKAAQEAINRREQLAADETAQRTTLDLNAAERARQEAAPTGAEAFTYEKNIPSMVDTHPLVQKAEQRVAKAGAILTKMHMAGEVSASKLARAAKDLEHLTKAEAATRANVEATLRENAPKKQSGVTYLNSGIPLRKKDLSRLGRLGKQQGHLYLGEDQSQFAKYLKGNKILEDMMPEHTTVAATPEGVVAKAAQVGDVSDRGLIGKTTALFTKGFLYEKLKTNNPIVKYTYDRLSDAVDAAKNKTHQLLQEDSLPKIRELSDNDMVELHQAMHDAMMGKYELSAADLSKHGFTDKQVAAWESLQRGYDDSFKSINAALVEAGHKPIEKYTAYMAGMATGDFRTAIVKKVGDGEPQFMGFIGSNVKWMRDKRVAEFIKANPEYSVGPESFHGQGMVRGNKGASMVEALQLLAGHSPDMELFAKQLGEHLTGDAYNYMNAKTHTMQKRGVFGMEGSKQWVTGVQSLLPLSAEQRKAVIAKQNALDGFRAQVRYIETMATWAEMSKAVGDLKKVFSDPSIQERQKNALAMSKEYLRNAMGDNPSVVGPAADRLFSSIGQSLGLGPSLLGSAVRGTKQGINTIFFGANPVFVATNLMQGFITTPTTINYLRSRGFDTARLDRIGLVEYTKASMDGYAQWQNPRKDAFSIAMWDYGKKHGISSTQIFEHSTDIRKGASQAFSSVMEAGLGVAEGMPRSTVYAMISNILKDTGFANHPDIFKVARELTDKAMVDYRPHEGQRINNYFGPAGPLLSNLSSYAGNANSLIANLVREVKTHKSGGPVIAALITGLVVHGVMGFPGFDEADKLVEAISTANGTPTTLTNEVMKAASKHKEVGDFFAVGMGSSLGLDLHQTLGRSSMLPSQLGAGGAGKAVSVGKAAFTAATNPSEMNAKRLGYELSPKLARNWEDLTWFSQGNLAMNKKEGFSTQGAYRRTPEDISIHKLGATSLNEYKNKETMRQQTLQDTHYREKQTKILNTLQDKLVSRSGLEYGDVPKALQKYIEVEGNPSTFITKMVEMKIGMNTDMMQRYLMQKAQAGDVSAVKALKRMQENSQ